MNKIKNLMAFGAFAVVMLCVPAIASAQWGNGGYNNNYNIKQNVKNLKNRAKDFERSVDRYDDRYDRRGGAWGNWGGGRSSDRLESLAEDFRKAADRLENKYGNGRNLNNSADEARRVLDIASQIDREIRSTRNNNLQSQWNAMRYDLNQVANTYGYNGNRNRRGDRNGNWRNNIPFPLPF